MADNADDYNNEDEDEELKRLEGNHYETIVAKAAGQGNLEDIQYAHSKKPQSILFEDKNKKFWSPLIWASSKNHVHIVKFLIENGALEPYLKIDEVAHPSKCTLGVINSSVKPTPLQWACFQGNLQIVWLLLKNNSRYQDVDQFGNNCLHLAASGGSLKVFESLLMHGVDSEGKNSRNHSVLDLATNQDIINLIHIHSEATKCNKSGQVFDDDIKKHWCQTCRQIYSPECFEIKWTWETPQSDAQERIDGKCVDCWKNIAKHSEELQQKMTEYQQVPLEGKLEEINAENVEIDLKLLQKAKELQIQLKTQNQILDFIESLKVIEFYKTIFKSVHLLEQMKEDALSKNINLDENVLEKTNAQIARLNSERKLRFDLDNMKIGGCTIEDKKELGESIEDSQHKNVAENYLQEAIEMREKMEKSLNANDIYKLFIDYKTLPEEDYPTCCYLDKKTQKVFDPLTKKPADSKRFPPPKKKKPKKGQPKLVIPDWAADSHEQLDEKIKTLKTLLESAEDCKFETDFIEKCQAEIKRMMIEWKYRVALAEETRLVAEWKLAQKKKK